MAYSGQATGAHALCEDGNCTVCCVLSRAKSALIARGPMQAERLTDGLNHKPAIFPDARYHTNALVAAFLIQPESRFVIHTGP